MFQTEIILFLQSFEAAWLNVFVAAVNSIGYENVFAPILMIITLGVSFRKGFYVVQVVIWTGLVTVFLKEFIGLPRPSEVDANVTLINKDYLNPTKFESMGASSFWGLPPQEVITYYRGVAEYSHGFPSGHVSLTTALWGTIYRLLGRSWIKALSIALIVLMPFTRMYLGRHFLADVLCGLLLGTIFMLLYFSVVYNPNWAREIFARRVSYFALNPSMVMILIYFLVLPFVMFWLLPPDDAGLPGKLFGFNVGFMLLTIRGIPQDGGPLLHKILRILIAGVLFFGLTISLKKIGFDDVPILEFLRAAIAAVVAVFGTIELCVKLRLYTRSSESQKNL